MLFSLFRGTYSGQVPLPQWVQEVNLAMEMGWTEKQLKEDNTIEFLEKISIYNSEKAKAEKMNDMTSRMHAAHTPQHKGRR